MLTGSLIQRKGKHHLLLKDTALIENLISNNAGFSECEISNKKRFVVALAEGISGNPLGELASRYVLSRFLLNEFSWRNLKLNRCFDIKGNQISRDKCPQKCLYSLIDTVECQDRYPMLDFELSDQDISEYNIRQIYSYLYDLNSKLIEFGLELPSASDDDPSFEKRHRNDSYLATSFAAIFKIFDRCYIAYAGNTRAGVIKNGSYTQLTKDQFYSKNRVSENSNDSDNSSENNGIMTAFGNGSPETFQPVVIDITDDFAESDFMLFTTDGIHGVFEESNLTDELLLELNSQNFSHSKFMHRLIDICYEQNPAVDMSAVLLKIK